uniref:Protein kinase domain-containing protein n=1 Tax=Corethron hystrix TaxID=216773 RepID=A0A7S1BNC5_9STRA
MLAGMGKEDVEEAQREALLMSRLRHPNIVLIMGISTSYADAPKNTVIESLCILTEFMEMGSLADILQTVRQQENPEECPEANAVSPSCRREKYGPIAWDTERMVSCALQAARGIAYLHSCQPPICHRDLKCSNIEVDARWVVKVTDFGVSRILPDVPSPPSCEHAEEERVGLLRDDRLVDEKDPTVPLGLTSNLGTTAYAAPEMLVPAKRTHYSLKVDVYSFGMVLWEMLERQPPFMELKSRFDIMEAVVEGRRPLIHASCSDGYANLFRWCVAHAPQDRPTFPFIVRKLEDEAERAQEASRAATARRESGKEQEGVLAAEAGDGERARSRSQGSFHDRGRSFDYSSKMLEQCDNVHSLEGYIWHD